MRGVPRREPMRGVPRRLELIELLRTRYPDTSERELLARILRGQVTVNGEKALKPGTRVAADAEVRLQPTSRFVSRGGEKLAAAIRAWNVDCAGAAWIDAGSSRGGFTDCLLQHGAPLVYAVDVGVGQLDWRLRTDRRVRAMEGTNILHVARAALDPPPGRAVADLSFRSLRGAARHILELTTEGWGIFLAKPQFELREPPEDFRGVIREPGAAREIARELLRGLAREGVRAENAMLSPVAGRRGNREYLLLLRRGEPEADGGSAALADLLE